MSDDLDAKKYYDESYFEVQKAVGIANVTEISHIFFRISNSKTVFWTLDAAAVSC